jgi:hypothetical protein
MFVLFFWGVAQKKYDPLQNVRLRLVFLHSLLGKFWFRNNVTILIYFDGSIYWPNFNLSALVKNYFQLDNSQYGLIMVSNVDYTMLFI